MGPVYKTPEQEPLEAEVLKLISELREQLRFRVAEKPRRWAGHLRRRTGCGNDPGTRDERRSCSRPRRDGPSQFSDGPPIQRRQRANGAMPPNSDSRSRADRRPVFSSIEEYLGRNTSAYYEVLGQVGQGQWNPRRDARPWVRFCLTAHYHQARTQVRRIREIERLYSACDELARGHGLSERSAGPLAEAALGLRLRNASYRSVVDVTHGEELSDLTASRDLRAIVDAGLFEPIGQNRGRHYVARPTLRGEYERIRADRAPRETDDPFQIALGQLQLSMT